MPMPFPGVSPSTAPLVRGVETTVALSAFTTLPPNLICPTLPHHTPIHFCLQNLGALPSAWSTVPAAGPFLQANVLLPNALCFYPSFGMLFLPPPLWQGWIWCPFLCSHKATSMFSPLPYSIVIQFSVAIVRQSSLKSRSCTIPIIWPVLNE